MKDKVMDALQRFSKAMFIPVLILPIAGILIAVGNLFTNVRLQAVLPFLNNPVTIGFGTLLSGSLNAILGNLGVIFCVGLSVGLANKKKSEAGFISLLAFLVFLNAMNKFMNMRGMLVEARPKNFSELIQISGLSHGTDVWTGNADELIRSGTCTIAEVIGCRDSIMLYLLRKGLEPKMAFDIMEAVRKGKVAKGGFAPGWEEAMREHDVPDWYIESCRKIKYMFPKAHAVAYLMSAIRLMWFKLYHPQAFYAVYFTVRGDDIDYEAAVGGAAVARAHMNEVKRRLKEEKNAKDEDVLVSLQLVNEMLVRGYEFLPIELGKSRGSKYVVEDGKVRLPFCSLKGLGGAAADALENVTIHGEEYLSIEELQQASGVGSSIIDRLRQVGALGELPESSQVSFF